MDNTPAATSALSDALAEARARYVARNPLSRAQHERAADVMPGGNTRTVLFHDPFPLTIARGEGCRLWDADGHTYIDLLGEFTAGIYGHSHPAIRAAIVGALDRGLNLAGHTAMEAELARLVCDRFASIELVRFTNSGTEANLMALALAVAATGRRKIMVFSGAYHGGLLTFPGGRSPVNVPHDFVVAPYNDAEGAVQLITDDLAAILVEPMMGSAGCIPGDPAFLAALREAASRVGALLIFDEVMTSRLAPGGRQQSLGIAPDLTTLGKYVGGGMSFGAFGGRRDLMSRFDPRTPNALPHAGTFNNNVLTMAAGVAGLTQAYTPEAAIALNARGDALRERLNARCRGSGAKFSFTGVGSMLCAHATDAPIHGPADVPADTRRRDLFFFDMLERGIYLARRGFIALALPVGDAEIEQFEGAVAAFLDTHRAVLRD
ncbi:MAG: aminotransferase class III-fold pyridoxal phosphate-dependent enzyme [Alphaproteobacteria bacterium]|nr:aminotransferase class III-fold pyridoxal phosphate-dependent enzyme [Alphaproteobacteria bacterium]